MQTQPLCSFSSLSLSHSSNACHSLRAERRGCWCFCFSVCLICFCPEASGLKRRTVSFNFYSSSAWLSRGGRLAVAEMAQQLHMHIRWLRGKCLKVLSLSMVWSAQSMHFISRPKCSKCFLLSETIPCLLYIALLPFSSCFLFKQSLRVNESQSNNLGKET